MKMFSVVSAAFLVCAASISVFTSGCETESADELSISISPSHTKLSVGQSVTLRASGGWNYRWELSNYSIGSLSANAGENVVYTACGNGEQIVTLTGMGGAAHSSSNSVSTTGYSAKAVITHQGKDGEQSESNEK